jgi:hypothetical protein
MRSYEAKHPRKNQIVIREQGERERPVTSVASGSFVMCTIAAVLRIMYIKARIGQQATV